MATPRKKHKLRDADRTRRHILDVIGEIMVSSGHSGLKVNHIARVLGKDKTLIRYYYGSLANLEKAYIQEKDHWASFFERFTFSSQPGREEIELLFTDLMQEHFLSFLDNQEMQKIILWQISESNPLMRSISDKREASGAALLANTDHYFGESEVSFKAVIAVLLGGIYYMVLHAATNKSTVSGMDVNEERDRKIMLRTISQIISWACEAAGTAAKQSPKN